jgi:hypothetical protein
VPAWHKLQERHKALRRESIQAKGAEEYPLVAKRRPCKTYTKEFKLEALPLMAEAGMPASEVAMQLGIRRNR